ncbi:hypothetical protein [Limimaricola pyoseonensis]|uniref:Uncharacterized protein n=1 Tax=Limimaricola pyoseonensis TaxID=521013 RepID=A0A1G7J4Q8_9RHOB|nr:hypothetical protein [Limimaricola pyoseonensis]SDF19866.1 hypothetical protein SAMN04488567_3640 [Limimaricola pyoseonensis]
MAHTTAFQRSRDLADWLSAILMEPEAGTGALGHATLVRMLDNEDIRRCHDLDALQDFIVVMNAARRGSEGPWAPLRRLLTRSRMASLSQEAEDQINRLYLASPALRAELDSDIALMMACAAETRQAS